MSSCNTYHLTWVSLNLGVGYLFTAAPAKRSHCSLPWMRGISFTAALPDLQHGIAPLGPPVPAQPLPLDVGWLFPAFALALGVGWLLLAAAPDLRCRVAPLSHSCAVAAWHSRLLPLTSDIG